MEAFEMPVQSIFHMHGHGTLFQGKVVSGRISVGNRIIVASPNNRISTKVEGIEEISTRNFLQSAGCGNDIAILVRNIDLNVVRDGWTKSEEGIVVPLALRVCNDPRPWWKFWP